MTPQTTHRRHCLVLTLIITALCTAPRPTLAAPPTDPILIHTVQPGETLFRIGLQYGIPWTDIYTANNLTSTVIYVGQQLVIPTANLPIETAQQIAASGTTTYRVQRGDVLSLIAQRYGTTIDVIVALNNLLSPNLVYPGQVLTLPAASPLTPAGPAPTPGPAVTAAAKRIVVDISEQRMYVYQDNQLVYNFVASTGLPGRDTAVGNFAVQSKIPNAYGSTWDIWMPNWLGIYWVGHLENGIHALPILPGGAQLWAGYLGTRISYGCVVLSMEDSTTLYNWADLGTPVDIQY